MTTALLPIAIGLTALRSATKLWVDLTFHITIATFLVATYKARFTRESGRAWWFGFALGGWSYLLLALAAPGTWHMSGGYNLVTDHVIYLIIEGIEPQPPSRSFIEPSDRIYLILHYIFSIFFALAGALIVTILRALDRRKNPVSRPDALEIAG